MASLSDAARFLTPRAICVATAAASASRGVPSQGALPVLRDLALDTESAPEFAQFLDLLDSFVLEDRDRPGMPLSPSSTDGVECISDFVDNMITNVDCVEDLFSVVDELSPGHEVDRSGRLFGVYDRDGPIACLLRRVSVLFMALPFHAAASLVDALQQYVAGNKSESSDLRVTPTSDAEKDAAAHVLAAGSPVASDELYESIQSGPPRIASHLESLRRRDYAAATSALHRHCDVSLGALGSSADAGADAVSSNSPQVAGADSAQADARGHQYAALSLAALHFQMGHSRTATSALDDAVRTAQQCGDDSCQARALSWIARTSASTAQRHLLLQHAGDPLPLAREELLSVITPSTNASKLSIGTSQKQSFWVQQQRREAALSSARMDRLRSRIGFPRAGMSVDMLVILSAAWESHGSLPTARAIAGMALRAARREQRKKAARDASAGSATILTEGEAHAMAAVCSLDAKSGRAEEAIADVRNTIFSKNTDRIKPDFAPNLSSSRPEREILLRCLHWVEFERALRMGEIHVAEDLCDTIGTFTASNAEGMDLVGGPDAELDAIEARTRVLIAFRHFQEAVETAETLCLRGASLSRPARVVEGHRLAAEARIQAQAPNLALSQALSAVSLAQGLGLEAAHVRSVLTLTEAMLLMDGSTNREAIASSSRTLDDVLPRALEGLDVSCRGRARRLQAECLLGLVSASRAGSCPSDGMEIDAGAKQSQPDDTDDPSEKRSQVLLPDVASEIVELLGEAIHAYRLAEDVTGLKDCYYILARVHHELGDIQRRDEAATAFCEQTRTLARARIALR